MREVQEREVGEGKEGAEGRKKGREKGRRGGREGGREGGRGKRASERVEGGAGN